MKDADGVAVFELPAGNYDVHTNAPENSRKKNEVFFREEERQATKGQRLPFGNRFKTSLYDDDGTSSET